VLCSPRLQRTAALTAPGDPRLPLPLPRAPLPSAERAGAGCRSPRPRCAERPGRWGFCSPAEFPNCHTTSALRYSSGCRPSAQARRATMPCGAETPSSRPGLGICPESRPTMPGRAAGTSPGQREAASGSGARAAHTSPPCHCVSAVCRPRAPLHDAHGDSPPRCPAAAADAGHGQPAWCRSHRGLSRPVPKHQPAPSLPPPPQTARTSKDIFQVSLAWTWRRHHDPRAPAGLFPCSVGQSLNPEAHQHRHLPQWTLKPGQLCSSGGIGPSQRPSPSAERGDSKQRPTTEQPGRSPSPPRRPRRTNPQPAAPTGSRPAYLRVGIEVRRGRRGERSRGVGVARVPEIHDSRRGEVSRREQLLRRGLAGGHGDRRRVQARVCHGGRRLVGV